MINKVEFNDTFITIVEAIDRMSPVIRRHHTRVGIISYFIGRAMELSEEDMRALVIAATLHDVGILTKSDALEMMDIMPEETKFHATLGAFMVQGFDCFGQIEVIIRHHHVVYDEGGPRSQRDIPITAYILHAADRIDAMINRQVFSYSSKDKVRRSIKTLRGTLLDPMVVDKFMEVSLDKGFWLSIDEMALSELYGFIALNALETVGQKDMVSLGKMVGRIVDYRSRYTYTHSICTAYIAEFLAKATGMDEATVDKLVFASYILNLGKLSLSNEIIDKELALTSLEHQYIEYYPYHTRQVLAKIPGLEDITHWIGCVQDCVYEKSSLLNSSEILDIHTELLVCADLFVTLIEERPYRLGHELVDALAIIEDDYLHKQAGVGFHILKSNGLELYKYIQNLKKKEATEFERCVVKQAINIKVRHHYLEAELYDMVRTDPVFFQQYEESSSDGLWFWDLELPENKWISPKFWTSLGYSPSEKRHLAEELNKVVVDEDWKAIREALEKMIGSRTTQIEKLVRLYHCNGSIRYMRLKGQLILDKDGKALRLIGNNYDVTDLMKPKTRLEEQIVELKEERKKLEYDYRLLVKSSGEDPLTGLYNRYLFNNLMEEELKKYHRQQLEFSIIMLDFDEFKLINDNYGHMAGDEVLKDCARRLEDILREQDIKCRWGGDEFLVLLPETSYEDVKKVVTKIMATEQDWFIVYRKHTIHYSFTLGYATYNDQELIEDLFERVDQVLYEEKRRKQRKNINKGKG